MKLSALACICFAMPLFCPGQKSEFEIHPNGYIYDEKTMCQLRYIVDSLNLEFVACDFGKTYYAKYQACAHFIKLDTGNIKEAKKDLENNMPFNQFVAKFPECSVELDVLVVKFMTKDYEDKDIVEFILLPQTSYFQQSITVRNDPAIYKRNMNQKWLVDYESKTNYSKESLVAYYFTSNFISEPIFEKYNRLIQYSNCLIDTNGIIFTSSEPSARVKYEEYQNSKVGQFLKFIKTEIQPPKYNAADHLQYYKEMESWDKVRLARIDNLIRTNERCRIMLEAAVQEALAKGISNTEFESYVAEYYSKKVALDLKRNRRVVGFCSQDDGPRIHAREIAILSAETVQWDIFLRAHLDIMNDNFERNSDGNYAWGRRETYIHELEELDINVIDLLVGIALRIENPSQNHYFGSIRRLGRALAETQQKEAFENKILSMIEDQDLDDFNRLLMFYLYNNYKNYSLTDETKEEINKSVQKASQMLPDYIASKIDSNNE